MGFVEDDISEIGFFVCVDRPQARCGNGGRVWVAREVDGLCWFGFVEVGVCDLRAFRFCPWFGQVAGY